MILLLALSCRHAVPVEVPAAPLAHPVGDLLAFVDPSVDPCEDFYAHVCGPGADAMLGDKVFPASVKGFIAVVHATDPPPSPPLSPTSWRDARDFHDACMDVDRIEARGLAPLETDIAPLLAADTLDEVMAFAGIDADDFVWWVAMGVKTRSRAWVETWLLALDPAGAAQRADAVMAFGAAMMPSAGESVPFDRARVEGVVAAHGLAPIRDYVIASGLEVRQIALPPSRFAAVRAIDRHVFCDTTTAGMFLPVGEAFLTASATPEDLDVAAHTLSDVRDVVARRVSVVGWLDASSRGDMYDSLAEVGTSWGVGDTPGWDEPLPRPLEMYEAITALSARQGPSRSPIAYPTINAMYDEERRLVSASVGLVLPPFSGASMPRAAVYGASGMIMGHELGHWVAAEADGRGKWETIVERSSCPGSGLEASVGTQEEDFADALGLDVAWRAWQEHAISHDPSMTSAVEGLSDNRLFFVAYARLMCGPDQPDAQEAHSTPELRVNAAVSRVRGFAEAYACPAEAPMARADDCLGVW